MFRPEGVMKKRVEEGRANRSSQQCEWMPGSGGDSTQCRFHIYSLRVQWHVLWRNEKECSLKHCM